MSGPSNFGRTAPPSQVITVSASLVPSSATVTYGAVVTTGSVAIAATGLPGGAIPVFTLTSAGTTRTLNGAGTVTALSAGTWTVSAGTVSSGGSSYTPTPSVSFVYALVATTPPGGGTNYAIPNVYLTPIVVGALTGNASSANKASFLSSVSCMFPLNAISSDVRAPSTMHFYGVLKVSYTSGIAGYGYVPGRAAIGWDHRPSGDRVAAHECGHNFSRDHAPCGTTGDADYPYPGGVINNWGWNSVSNALVPPTWTDVMGYCDNQWISDYNWSAVMQYRSASGGVSSVLAVRTNMR